MIKLLTFLSLFLSLQAFAQDVPLDLSIPIETVCRQSDTECIKKYEDNSPLIFDFNKTEEEKLKIRIFFGNTRTAYLNTDIRVRLEDSDFTLHDTPIKARTSDRYFEVWKAKRFQDIFRFIDEPTNTFILSFEKNKNAFSFTYFHPKYLITWLWDEPGTGEYHNPRVRITGNYQGNPLDEYINLAENYQNEEVPAFPVFRNTKRQVQLSLGYGRVITLFDPKKGSKIKLDYTPNLAGGVHIGDSNLTYTPFVDGQKQWIEQVGGKLTYQGFSLSLNNRLQISGKKDRFGLFIDHRLNFSKKKYPILEGTGEAGHFLNYNSFTFGLHLRIK